MIHPGIPAELPGINLERDLHTPSRVTIRRKPSVTEQATAARISAGLDAPQEDNVITREVLITDKVVQGDLKIEQEGTDEESRGQ